MMRLFVVIGARSDAVEIRQCAAYHRRMSALRGTIHRRERREVAVSRRPGDENNPWPPNGDLRPNLDTLHPGSWVDRMSAVGKEFIVRVNDSE